MNAIAAEPSNLTSTTIILNITGVMAQLADSQAVRRPSAASCSPVTHLRTALGVAVDQISADPGATNRAAAQEISSSSVSPRLPSVSSSSSSAIASARQLRPNARARQAQCAVSMRVPMYTIAAVAIKHSFRHDAQPAVDSATLSWTGALQYSSCTGLLTQIWSEKVATPTSAAASSILCRMLEIRQTWGAKP